MAIIIRKASDPIAVETIKAVFYGQPGVGKTSFAFTAKNPLLLDYDDGIKRVDEAYRGDSVAMKTWQDSMDLFSSPAQLKPYNTIIMDTVGRALDQLAAHIMKSDIKLRRGEGELTIQGYGVLKTRFKAFLDKLSALGMHIIMIAHDKESKDKDDLRVRPDITGQTLATIIREADLVGYMRSHNNHYSITFTPTDAFYGKNSCGLPNNMNMRETLVSDIIDTALKNMNKDPALYEKYKQQIVSVKNGLAEAKNAEELTRAMNTIMLMKNDFVSDARAQSKKMLNDRAKELNCTFNKTTNEYEDAKSTVPGKPGNN